MCAHCNTLRFGTIEYNELDTIRMRDGIVPFTDAHRFVLVSNTDEEPFSWLQCVDDPALALVVAPLDILFSEHASRLRETLKARSGPRFAERVALLGVVVLAPDPSQITINLVAPLVVDFETMTAEQVVLDAPVEWTRHPLAPAFNRPLTP